MALKKLVCSFRYVSTTKDVQIMIQGYLDPFYAKVKFCHLGICMGKNELLIFWKLVQFQNFSKDSTK